ncbi:hypothetical protein ACLI4Z_15980 [Natrialbaceae archaeon A-arb3/5]
MPDCDYCDASPADEEVYLEHLAAEHAGDLGPIDQRRVAEAGTTEHDDGLTERQLIAYGLALSVGLLVIGSLGYVITVG